MSDRAELTREQLRNLSYELDGVLADVKNGRFDEVCRNTVQRVRDALASLDEQKAVPQSGEFTNRKPEANGEGPGKVAPDAHIFDVAQAAAALLSGCATFSLDELTRGK